MKLILAFKFVPSFYIQATWKGTIRHCCTFTKTLEPFCIFSKMYLSNLQMLKNKTSLLRLLHCLSSIQWPFIHEYDRGLKHRCSLAGSSSLLAFKSSHTLIFQ